MACVQAWQPGCKVGQTAAGYLSKTRQQPQHALDLLCRCMAGVARSPIARAAAANLVVTTLAILINNHRGASSASLTSSMATIAVEVTATLGGELDGMSQQL